jgi:hypothetical protein
MIGQEYPSFRAEQYVKINRWEELTGKNAEPLT